MKTHKKKRLKGIKHLQEISLCKSHLRSAYIYAANEVSEMPHDPTNDVLVMVVQSLSTKRLKLIVNCAGRFASFPHNEELIRLAEDEFMLRELNISK